MKVTRLLDQFERIAYAPNAIARLRGLILDLAARGKLVPRDRDNGAVPEALQELNSRWTSRARNGNGRGADNSSIWPIPATWLFMPLELLAKPGGLFTDGDWVETKDQDPGGDVRLIQLADVGTGQFRDRSARFMTHAAALRLNCTFLSPGDVLIARMPDPIGRACIFPGDEKKSVTVVDVAVLRVDAKWFDPRYVMHVINSQAFANNVQAKTAGTTRTRISGGNLRELPFPATSLNEQRKIAAQVDKLMLLCDQLEVSLATENAIRGRLLNALLAEALATTDQ